MRETSGSPYAARPARSTCHMRSLGAVRAPPCTGPSSAVRCFVGISFFADTRLTMDAGEEERDSRVSWSGT